METNSARERPKSAVEKAGAWKPAKTRSRFPPAPTLPWKSRQRREIPTFPPRRRRRLSSPRKRPRQKQRPNPKPRRRPNGRVALFHKADRSRIYKTGQLDLLTTGSGMSSTPIFPHSGESEQLRESHDAVVPGADPPVQPGPLAP